MKKRTFSIFLLSVATMLLLAGCAHEEQSEPIDCIVFGNIANESAHNILVENSTDYVSDGGVTARRFMPDRRIRWKAGECTFVMRVDSVAQNYFTLLLNAKERAASSIMLFVNGKQVGYRGLGDIGPLYSGVRQKGDGYYYVTLPLPLTMTEGESSVKIGVRCFGPVNLSGDDFENFQLSVQSSSVGVYGGYTHTQTQCPVPFDENLANGVVAKPDVNSIREILDSFAMRLMPVNDGDVFFNTQTAVVAVRHNGELFCASLRWQASFAVNRLAKVYLSTPKGDYHATVYEDVAKPYFCGLSYHRTGFVGDDTGEREWYRGVISANSGEKMLVSRVPRGEGFRPGMKNELAGRARCYALTYGNYWVAMNTTNDESFTLGLPKEFLKAVPLTAEPQRVASDSIKVAPQTTVILYR